MFVVIENMRRTSYPPESITLLALGPLTNIATALLLDPTLPSRAAALVIGGGAVNCAHNIPFGDRDTPGQHCDMPMRPKYEFNMWFDATAANYVLLV